MDALCGGLSLEVVLSSFCLVVLCCSIVTKMLIIHLLVDRVVPVHTYVYKHIYICMYMIYIYIYIYICVCVFPLPYQNIDAKAINADIS